LIQFVPTEFCLFGFLKKIAQVRLLLRATFLRLDSPRLAHSPIFPPHRSPRLCLCLLASLINILFEKFLSCFLPSNCSPGSNCLPKRRCFLACLACDSCASVLLLAALSCLLLLLLLSAESNAPGRVLPATRLSICLLGRFV